MRRFAWLIALSACGGHRPGPTGPMFVSAPPPRLLPTVTEQSFYRSKTSCAQGPFTLDVPVGAAKYGEAIELAVRAPRRIAIHATITAGTTELASIDDTFDASGRVGGNADNARCVADARERLAAERARRAGTQPPTTTSGGSGLVTTPGPGAPATSAASVAAELEVVPGASLAVDLVPVLNVKVPAGVSAIRITWWSIQPNDLEGAAFALSHVVWKPDIGEERYEAYLAEQEAKRIADEKRAAELHEAWLREEEQRRQAHAIEEEKRARARAELALKRQREADERRQREAAEAPARPKAVVKITVETEEQRRLRIEMNARLQRERQAELNRLEAERLAREEAAQRTREARMRAAAEEAEKRRLHVEAVLRAKEERKQFCASHPADRSCWGPGGLDMKLQLDARVEQAKSYCAQHHEDARCWTAEDRQRIAAADQERMAVALTPPSKPDGPPPAPLAETMPPRLSVNATWRPGYWHWVDNTWVWLAGMWRVPEADIVAEQTTTAPIAPPALQVETPSAAPVASAVWTAGFWQWDGAKWIWIAGSWQLRPSATVTWRAASWQPRGRMHVLVPGAWIRMGASR